jgi:hypothetical protein
MTRFLSLVLEPERNLKVVVKVKVQAPLSKRQGQGGLT